VFIRRTKSRNAGTGEDYYTHRLVESVRVGDAVKQRTLLNLGAQFDVPKPEWLALTARMDALLHGQDAFLPVSPAVEAQAQRYVALLIAARKRQAPDERSGRCDPSQCYQAVDLDSLELVRPRSVGVEHAALTAARWFGLDDKLAELGLNRPQIAAALGNIIGRMVAPASELATFEWLQRRSALGELIGYDYEGMHLIQLYRSAVADGLTKPRGTRDPAKINQRIGRARQKYARAAQHYAVELSLDEAGKTVTAITWTRAPKANSAMANPGVYCLRTTLSEPDDATLWRIYSMLTNLEAVFRSLKTDLGLRPVFHRIDRRMEGHLFISLLAYCLVHAIRLRLKDAGINDAWETIRNTMSIQVRITTTLKQSDGRAVHVRKASRPEPHQKLIYDALDLSPNPGGTLRAAVKM
jgi:hypothetical protein